jgi:hypothetical protein
MLHWTRRLSPDLKRAEGIFHGLRDNIPQKGAYHEAERQQPASNREIF